MAGARPDTWMPMFWGDYLRDTGHLSTTEHGAYLLFIGHYWSSGGPLPDDDAQLARIAKIGSVAKWRKMRPTIAALFKVGDGVWRHKRIDEELAAAAARSKHAKVKAEKAAKARWQGQHDDIPEAPHGADDDDAPSIAPSIAEDDHDEDRRAKHDSENDQNFIDFQNPNLNEQIGQAIEIIENRDAWSIPQAMLEECPPQPQYRSSLGNTDVEERDSSAEESFVAARETSPGGDVDEAFDLWLRVAYDLRIPDAGFLNGDRRRLLTACLAECGPERWRQAMTNLREADWLRRPDDPSRPLHWVNLANILKPENFMGLLEGRYAERHQGRTTGTNGKIGAARRSVLGASVFAGVGPQDADESEWRSRPDEVGTAEGDDAAGDHRPGSKGD